MKSSNQKPKPKMSPDMKCLCKQLIAAIVAILILTLIKYLK